MTTNNLQVPEGWRKKEPLVISKILVSGERVWTAEQQRAPFSDNNFNPNNIAIIWFHSFDELTEFLNWWHT